MELETCLWVWCNYFYQFCWIWNHLGDTVLGVSVGKSPEKRNWGMRSALNVVTPSCGPGSWTDKETKERKRVEHHIFNSSASWSWTQCNQPVPTTICSLGCDRLNPFKLWPTKTLPPFFLPPILLHSFLELLWYSVLPWQWERKPMQCVSASISTQAGKKKAEEGRTSISC